MAYVFLLSENWLSLTMYMRKQPTQDIIEFLKNNVKPLEDGIYGPGYRASVYLTDGTFLPCVIFRSADKLVTQAIKRFKQELSGKDIFQRNYKNGYNDIVKLFVTTGNHINEYDIDSVERSNYAFPLEILKQIKGETTMGWTGFALKMTDGKVFGFGSTFRFEFFKMPERYSVNDIKEVVNHSYVLKTGEIRSYEVPFFTPPNDYNDAIIYRERPFFECYIDTL